jgi:hypothetical protein
VSTGVRLRVLWLVLAGWGVLLAGPAHGQSSVRFAVIGDFGAAGQPAQDVAALVQSWTPDFIVTTGDNNYPDGAASTIDDNVGQYYHAYIFPYAGAWGAGAAVNRFFPVLGNHDWNTAGAQPYRDYFTLPGNERYYETVKGPVHLFVVDSDPHEPDGNTAASIQGQWLQSRLAASTAPWKLVFMHHSPYSSGPHGSSVWMQWPFQAWGADAVLSGHDHLYERFALGIPYFVNGLGGNPALYEFQTVQPGSQARFTGEFGAMQVVARDDRIDFRFYRRNGALVDSLTLPGEFALTVGWTGAASGTVVSDPPGIDCGAACSAGFATDSRVTLTATPATGAVFTGWGGACTGTGSCTVTLDAAKSVTATFAPTVALTVVRSGTGNGVVTGPGIDCGTSCSSMVVRGATVALTAIPGPDSVFTGWSAAACGVSGTCTLSVTAATTVTATFTLRPLSLTVSKAASGGGTVTSSPAGIDCPPACASATAAYAAGTTVTLTALAAGDSVFAGWSGGGCAGLGPCTVVMSAGTTVQAAFALRTTPSVGLSVAVGGSGDGAVASDPAGIQCEATCAASFVGGAFVRLTAAPGPGATFKAWGGACSGPSPSCTLAMTSARSVSATFSAVFVDPSLSPRTTPIRAVHVTDLRAAIDTLRRHLGLPAVVWTDALLVPGATLVKRAHVIELRAALREAYQTAGRGAPTFTDETVTAWVTPIKALHLNEVRAAVRALE